MAFSVRAPECSQCSSVLISSTISTFFCQGEGNAWWNLSPKVICPDSARARDRICFTDLGPWTLYFFNKCIYFIYFWLHWVFVAACGLSLVAASGGYSSLQCVGFSLRWLLFRGALVLGVQASVVVAHRLSSCGSRALECRLSSCGTRASSLCGTWDLPGPGLKPVSPALAGRFSTTAPPGESLGLFNQ